MEYHKIAIFIAIFAEITNLVTVGYLRVPMEKSPLIITHVASYFYMGVTVIGLFSKIKPIQAGWVALTALAFVSTAANDLWPNRRLAVDFVDIILCLIILTRMYQYLRTGV